MAVVKGRIDQDGRECSACGKYKLWSEFSPNPRAKLTGHQAACKECRNARQIAKAESDRPAYRTTKRDTQARRRRAAGDIPRRERWRITDEGRICTRCLTWKPWGEFYQRPDFREGKSTLKGTSVCKLCRKIIAQEERLARFGITKKQYEYLLEKGNHACWLCGEPESRINYRTGASPSLCIEHDHSCPHHTPARGCQECVRGLACDCCNRMLALIEQKPQLIAGVERFEDYLSQRPLLAS